MHKHDANYTPLSPLSFLKRTAKVYPEKIAVIQEDTVRTWKETYRRICQFASALTKQGISTGDTVVVMAPNISALFEAHYAVPMAGAVLNALNTRLDSDSIAYILQHSECKLCIVDYSLYQQMKEAVKKTKMTFPIFVIEKESGGSEHESENGYERFIKNGDPDFNWNGPENEWDDISINYTSGTTGKPKGVVYHHRGAYLNTLGNITAWALPHFPVYLWTLPMFHCNGWCFPWTITAMAGTHICLREINAATIYAAIKKHDISHLCGAPVIMNMIVNASDDEKHSLKKPIKMMTAGAAPPAAVLEKMDRLGFDITHVYGLTEVYGPVASCAWDPKWDSLPAHKKAQLKARQGVNTHVLEDLSVVDPRTAEAVPADGKTMGEVVMKGNVVMKGYLNDDKANEDAFKNGWFYSGDLAVMHANGYIEIKDRSKDIIISGGENISTIEVEDVLYSHPNILEASVVAMPHDKWGERPCAFVMLKENSETTEGQIIEFCRKKIAHFKCPDRVVFGELPKTSTGKIKKFELRASLSSSKTS